MAKTLIRSRQEPYSILPFTIVACELTKNNRKKKKTYGSSVTWVFHETQVWYDGVANSR